MEPTTMLPTWAPRVTQQQIRQLYAADAQGIYDEELIAAVGYGLLARCQSFLEANEAAEGRARCPRCDAVICHTGRKEELLRCACGWELPWGEYFKTIQHMQLSGAEPVRALFRTFLAAFPLARSLQEQVVQIDRLLHGFHWYYKTNGPTRPVAINLIQGRLGEVIALLDSLTYGEQSTPGTVAEYARWQATLAESWAGTAY